MQIIKADRIIVGDGKTVLEQHAAVIKDGVIIMVGPGQACAEAYPEAKLVERPGHTLLPGLIDLHVHIGGLYRRPDAAALAENLGHLTLMACKHLQDAISVGITTVRSVGEPPGLGAAIRAGYHKGFINGPRYYTCERSISMTGGHGSVGSNLTANGPWELRGAVRQCIKDGADWIKVMSSHRSHHSEYTLEELCAVTEDAHRLGKRCCIHAGTLQSIDYAIEAGFDTLEHAPFINPQQAEKMVEKGIAWVPTAYVYTISTSYMKEAYQNPTEKNLQEIAFLEETVQGHRESVSRAYRAGVKIATGTDICFPEWFITPIQDEIITLHNLGLTELEALECATGTAAAILDGADKFGSIKDGLCADLLLVEGNPAEDIEAIRNVREVYRAGEVLYQA